MKSDALFTQLVKEFGASRMCKEMSITKEYMTTLIGKVLDSIAKIVRVEVSGIEMLHQLIE